MQQTQQPINHIQWIHKDKLKANNYNPNHVFPKELELIARSIQRNGWLQPIIINQDNTIIDGFHRVTLIKTTPQLSKLTNHKIPCIQLNLTPTQQKLLTIRINRAKGTHTAYKMHEVIQQLHHEGLTIETIAKEIGANKEEITLLLHDNIFEKENFTETSKYSQAWTPK